MRPLTLHAHEVRRLHAAGTVTLWRPVTPQPRQLDTGLWYWQPPRRPQRAPGFVWTDALDTWWWVMAIHGGDCPHGAPGETRWVREVWCPLKHDRTPIPRRDDVPQSDLSPYLPVIYKTDSAIGTPIQWRSPVTMPRWASRATVRVTGVVVKRVGKMDDPDAQDAGFVEMDNYEDPSPPAQFEEWWTARYGDKYPYPDAWCWGVTVTLDKENE